MIRETVDRAALWRAQTPQGFHFAAILAAHRAAAGQVLTDDAAVAEAAGIDAGRGCRQRGQPEGDHSGGPRRGRAAARRAPRRYPGRPGFRRAPFGPGDHVMDLRRRDPARRWPGRPFRRRCRPACADRRDPGRDRRRRYRHAFPAERSALARRRLRPVPAPGRGAGAAKGGSHRRRRCDDGLRAAEDRAAPRGDGRAGRRHPRHRARPGQRQGDDDRRAGLYRPRRRHRGASRRDRAAALYAAVAKALRCFLTTTIVVPARGR